jgi:hypothetical protein
MDSKLFICLQLLWVVTIMSIAPGRFLAAGLVLETGKGNRVTSSRMQVSRSQKRDRHFEGSV